MTEVAINAPAPDFNLLDFEGRDFQLVDQRGKQHVVLVFNRGFF